MARKRAVGLRLYKRPVDSKYLGDQACVCGFVGCPGLPMVEARELVSTRPMKMNLFRVLKEKPRARCRRVRDEVLRRSA